MNQQMLQTILAGWVIIAIIVFVLLSFISAPYGRHFRRNFGPAISAKAGWIIMESPAALVFALFFLALMRPITGTTAIFFFLWQVHYIDRSLIYPLTIRRSSRPLPLTILVLGIIFNSMNAYLNVQYLSYNENLYTAEWLTDIRFLAGLGLFLAGFAINRHADYILYTIRNSAGTDYGIPNSGLYRWISCPNYLGEILIWIGWTFATWSPVAAAFALWSIANLAPRARSHHKWYKEHFRDYPAERRILIPWVW